MSVSDPIADMLTRIRNATMVQHAQVTMPTSRMREAIARILKEEGFIEGYEVIPSHPTPVLRLNLRYAPGKPPVSVIKGLRRVSKPGRRVYVDRHNLPWVRAGLGIAIISTPKGVISDRQARRLGVGGEVLCYVW
ncbi:MAG: 30S ribosomal protein S8 [Anaerolineae bacterium]